MKKLLNIALAVLLVLGMTVGFVAATATEGHPATYEDGVLTLTINESDHDAQVIKISDGEIIKKGACPDVLIIVKLRTLNDDDSGLKYIHITINDVGRESDPINFPNSIVIYLLGDSDDAIVDPTRVFIDMRGEQVEPEDIPGIVIFDDMRGEQIIPEIIIPIVNPY